MTSSQDRYEQATAAYIRAVFVSALVGGASLVYCLCVAAFDAYLGLSHVGQPGYFFDGLAVFALLAAALHARSLLRTWRRL